MPAVGRWVALLACPAVRGTTTVCIRWHHPASDLGCYNWLAQTCGGRESDRSAPKLRWDLRQRWQCRIDLFSVRCIPTGTRPSPIRRPSTQSPSHGILVQVIDRVRDRLRAIKVPVVTWTFLPIAKRFDPGTLADRQPIQQGTGICEEDLFDSIRIWPFDRLQNVLNVRGRLVHRKNEKMDVLGHEDERRQPPIMILQRSIDRSR